MMGRHIQTSKVLLWLVVVGGLIMVIAHHEPSRHHMIIYSLILAGAIFNRLDSRRLGYKISATLGHAGVNIESGGDGEEDQQWPGFGQEVKPGNSHVSEN